MSDPLSRLRRFLRELKRRNVYRVAVTYLAVAFVGLQAARLLVPPTTLPGWADDLLIYLAVFGFPIALVLAWAFEMTADGMRRTPEAEPLAGEDQPQTGRARAGYRVLVGLGLIAAAAASGWYLTGGGGTTPDVSEGTVAVLPFQVSGSGAEIWHDAMVPLLNPGLDGAAGLRAIPDRTVLAAWEEHGLEGRSGSTGDALSVARDLGAQYAVVGTATGLGSGLQLTAGVYRTRSGNRIGQIEIRGSPDSVMALADTLKRQVLGMMLEKSDAAIPSVDLASLTTRSLPALKSYLTGERHLRAGEYGEAREDFEAAVDMDSTFALAWSRLQTARFITDARGVSQASERASELSDQLPERERRRRAPVPRLRTRWLAGGGGSETASDRTRSRRPVVLQPLRRPGVLPPSRQRYGGRAHRAAPGPGLPDHVPGRAPPRLRIGGGARGRPLPPRQPAGLHALAAHERAEPSHGRGSPRGSSPPDPNTGRTPARSLRAASHREQPGARGDSAGPGTAPGRAARSRSIRFVRLSPCLVGEPGHIRPGFRR